LKKPYFLYFINSGGICLFSYNFKNDIEMFQSDLFSGFVTAISLFSSELNEKLGYAEKYGRLPAIPLNLIFEIMISYTNSLMGVLVVEKKDIDKDMKDFLNDCLKRFMLKFDDIIENWGGDLGVFKPFKDEIEKIFKKSELFSFQIPKMRDIPVSESILDEKYLTVIKEIDGKKSIKEISQKMSKTLDEIKSIISNLLWSELITLSEKVYEDDIFEPKRDLFYLMRTKNLEPEKAELDLLEEKLTEYKLLGAIDGFKTVYNISEEFQNLSIYEIKHLLSFYLSKGSYIEKVELYPQILNIDDEFLGNLTTEDLVVSYSLENICDGELSLEELSLKIGFSIREIKKILDLLGKQVFYKKKYVE